MKEALDPQALEDAMNAMRYGPEMKARVMALAPGTYCGTFYRRKDGTMVRYEKKAGARVKIKARSAPVQGITVTLAEAIASTTDMTEARIIAVPPGTRFGMNLYKRKDGTIRKYRQPSGHQLYKKRKTMLDLHQTIKARDNANSELRHTIEARDKTICDLELHNEQLKKEIVNLGVALAERTTTAHLDPAGARRRLELRIFAKAAANDSNGD